MKDTVGKKFSYIIFTIAILLLGIFTYVYFVGNKSNNEKTEEDYTATLVEESIIEENEKNQNEEIVGNLLPDDINVDISNFDEIGDTEILSPEVDKDAIEYIRYYVSENPDIFRGYTLSLEDLKNISLNMKEYNVYWFWIEGQEEVITFTMEYNGESFNVFAFYSSMDGDTSEEEN